MSEHFQNYQYVAKLIMSHYAEIIKVETPATENSKPEDYIGKPVKDQKGKKIGEILAAEIIKNEP